MKHPLDVYLRAELLPTVFCPGCGNGIVAGALLRAISKKGYKSLKGFVFVSGIGAWVTSDPHFLSVRAFVEGLITLKSVEVSTFVSLHITFFPFL